MINKITSKNIRHFVKKFLKDYNDLKITKDESDCIVMEYNWCDYEEGCEVIITVNYLDYTIKKYEEGYSVEEGEYSDHHTMTFLNEHDLFANFKKGIKEQFCNLQAVLYV